MLNQVVICGRLMKDPDIRYMEDRKTGVINFSVAVDRDYITSSGERGTDFVECEAWRGAADFLSKYFHKGDVILVVGRLICRKWQTKNGENRYAMSVQADKLYFGESRSAKNARSSAPEQEFPLPDINSPAMDIDCTDSRCHGDDTSALPNLGHGHY